jgi:hypothetical protein
VVITCTIFINHFFPLTKCICVQHGSKNKWPLFPKQW